MTYEERLLKEAERFFRAITTNKGEKDWGGTVEDYIKMFPAWHNTWSTCLMIAEVAIAEMAECFDEGADKGQDSTFIMYNKLFTDRAIVEKRKHDLGLIKPTTDALELPETA